MKRILKIIGKLVLLIVGLVALIYLGFRLNEYVAGNKYVEYLKKNKLVSNQLGKSIPLKFDNDFFENQLFLVGEIHEVATSPVIDVSTFKCLNRKTNITTYIAEMDISQAYYINKYLKDSTDLSLERILNKWVVWIGTNSAEYREQKWGNLKEYYQQLDKAKRFEVFGVNRLNDFALLNRLLREKLPSIYSAEIPENKDSLVNWVSSVLPKILKSRSFTVRDSLLLADIEFNCSNHDKITSRDEFMYENFCRYYRQYNWITKKIYGCFGLYHTLQGINRTLAGRIKESRILNDNLVSLVALYTNSQLTVPSGGLPSYLAGSGSFTKLSYSCDDVFFGYIKGIEDFKRVSGKNSISLFKLNGIDSPYYWSNRGLDNFSLIKLFGSIPIDENKVTTDYIQYLFYADGSDWVQPNE
ncbi:hypothetical protein [Marinifilum sp.]|uniref:hypothetical protein n=1 Tax=Marinifilum sp. TaxID=2033137 RepID=UPI003BA9DF8C